ncbi:MAG: AraC family transcriptional regulator [Bacteroidota bacterium]
MVKTYTQYLCQFYGVMGMSSANLLLFFIASFGISLGLFFSLVLIRRKRRKGYADQLLALLLFFLSLRIGKSVFYNFLELPVFIKNLGLACNLAVGPLLWLYGQQLLKADFQWNKWQWLHFLPSLIYLIFCPILPNGGPTSAWHISYSLILLQAFSYASLSGYLWIQHRQQKSAAVRWYGYLTIGLTAMWLVYLFIFIGWIPVYLAGALSFTLLMSILAYLGLQDKKLFPHHPMEKYKQSVLSKSESQAVMQKVHQLLREQEVFLDAQLNLNKLAREVGISARLLSQVINENTGHNFSQLINGYRIDFAKQLLSAPHSREEKVISIAHQSGFNSLSTFNAAFKQHTAMTPTEFKKRPLSKSK